jgi:hypothetical protein
MTHREPMNEVEARELAIYATNDAALYRQMILSVIANLRRKQKKGVYDATKALKLWGYVADEAARRYRKEFHMVGGFNPATREAAAKEIAEHYSDTLEQNNV